VGKWVLNKLDGMKMSVYLRDDEQRLTGKPPSKYLGSMRNACIFMLKEYVSDSRFQLACIRGRVVRHNLVQTCGIMQYYGQLVQLTVRLMDKVMCCDLKSLRLCQKNQGIATEFDLNIMASCLYLASAYLGYPYVFRCKVNHFVLAVSELIDHRLGLLTVFDFAEANDSFDELLDVALMEELMHESQSEIYKKFKNMNYNLDQFSGLTVAELRAVAKEKSIRVRSRLRKDQVLRLLSVLA
jgi:hypothetical protein